MKENGTEQPKVYRCTRTMLKIRSTPTEAKQTGNMNDQTTESKKANSYIPAIPNMVRDCVKENSLENISPDPVQSTLPRLDLPQDPLDPKSEDREEIAESLCTDGTALEIPEENREVHLTLQDLASQQERTSGSQPAHLVTFTCKDTIASGSVAWLLKYSIL